MSAEIRDGQYFSGYREFTCQQWQDYASESPSRELDADALRAFRRLRSVLTVEELQEVYLPLASFMLQRFQQVRQQGVSSPFVIGITGSVAIGKTTLATALQWLLSRWQPEKSVIMLSTDDFLYPNAYLEAEELMHRKGFPDSYDMPAMLAFMRALKAGVRGLTTPVYSHEAYDIIADKHRDIGQPDIVIIEGLSILSLGLDRPNITEQQDAHNLVDFGVFIEANMSYVEAWFLQRAERLCRTAFVDPKAYFHDLSLMYPEQLNHYLVRVWQEINLENYQQHILPYKNRAQMIIEKLANHSVDRLWLRER